MTLERLIASKALELVQLLEHCDDPHFVDRIVDAVASSDYMELYELEDGKEREADAYAGGDQEGAGVLSNDSAMQHMSIS